MQGKTWIGGSGVNVVELALSEVVLLLAELHKIDPSRPTAVRGRVQALQQLGLPMGTNTGRGRAARYGPGQLMELLIAFELLQLGMTPERIALLIKDNRDVLRRVAGNASEQIFGSMLPTLRTPTNGEDDIFLLIDPAAFTQGAGVSASSWSGTEMFNIGPKKSIEKSIFHGARRRSIINITRVIVAAAQTSQMLSLASLDEWKDSFEGWASSDGDS